MKLKESLFTIALLLVTTVAALAGFSRGGWNVHDLGWFAIFSAVVVIVATLVNPKYILYAAVTITFGLISSYYLMSAGEFDPITFVLVVIAAICADCTMAMLDYLVG